MIIGMLTLAKEAVRIGMTGRGWQIITAKCMAAAIMRDDPAVSFNEASNRIFGNSYSLSRMMEVREEDLQALFEMVPGSIEAYEEMDRVIRARKNKEA